MFCPRCGNFTLLQAMGGAATIVCMKAGCGYQIQETSLRVLKSWYGQTYTPPAATSEELSHLAEDLASDPTLYSPPGIFCPQCKSALRVILGRDDRYTFICPTCRKVVKPDLPKSGR